MDIEGGNIGVDAGKTSPLAVNVTLRRTASSTRPVRVLLRRVAIMFAILAVLVALGAVIWYFLGTICLIQLILVAIVAYLAAGHYKWFVVAIKTLPRDIK